MLKQSTIPYCPLLEVDNVCSGNRLSVTRVNEMEARFQEDTIRARLREPSTVGR